MSGYRVEAAADSPCLSGGVHDWRIDQRHGLLLSDPPQQVLVCARCEATTRRTVGRGSATWSDDPRDWPKA